MTALSRRVDVLGLFGWLVVSYTASAIGAIASVTAKTFYAGLVQPEWAPPPGLFGPVWTLLYTLMGIAAWLVWREGGYRANRIALNLFLIQLAANALWSWLFFVWKLGCIAFAEILLLTTLIFLNLVVFRRVRALAAWLLLPYLLWVVFASQLNLALWQANPTILG